MITANLDVIVRRGLLEAGLPIHYYLEFLLHSGTALRELTFSTLKIINVVDLPVDNTGNIKIPNDFIDDISVCIPSGQAIKELPKQDWINPLRIHSATTGQYTTYTDLTSNNPQIWDGSFPLVGGFSWFWNVNSFGEPTGQFYGSRGGTSSGYAVFKEQRRIQLSENLIGTNVILLYISDGSSVDNATQIDPQAWACINAFINWKRSPNRDNKDSAEGRNFYNQMRTLVARLDPLTPEDIINTLHNAYTATIKN